MNDPLEITSTVPQSILIYVFRDVFREERRGDVYAGQRGEKDQTTKTITAYGAAYQQNNGDGTKPELLISLVRTIASEYGNPCPPYSSG